MCVHNFFSTQKCCTHKYVDLHQKMKVLARSIQFCLYFYFLESILHSKIQNHRKIPSERKVNTGEEERERNVIVLFVATAFGNIWRTHSARSNSQFITLLHDGVSMLTMFVHFIMLLQQMEGREDTDYMTSHSHITN